MSTIVRREGLHSKSTLAPSTKARQSTITSETEAHAEQSTRPSPQPSSSAPPCGLHQLWMSFARHCHLTLLPQDPSLRENERQKNKQQTLCCPKAAASLTFERHGKSVSTFVITMYQASQRRAEPPWWEHGFHLRKSVLLSSRLPERCASLTS